MSFISTERYTLTIEINNIRNSNGKILLELNDGNEKRVKAFNQDIIGNKCIIIVSDLLPGKYSFQYIHDENNNKEIDLNWIGIPKEGYGFSNNAKATKGPPDFIETIIELNSSLTHKCQPSYLL